jgi:hypothetical protein
LENSVKRWEQGTAMAESLEEARLKLKGKYGKGTVFDLHNEIGASTPR